MATRSSPRRCVLERTAVSRRGQNSSKFLNGVHFSNTADFNIFRANNNNGGLLNF
jgi:hypothetical protein